VLQWIDALSRDECHNVRLNVVKKLEILTQCFSPQAFRDHILPCVLDLAKDEKWRVRQRVLSKLHPTASVLGLEYYESRLSDLIRIGLVDHVFAVREAAYEEIARLMDVFGVDWVLQHIFHESEPNTGGASANETAEKPSSAASGDQDSIPPLSPHPVVPQTASSVLGLYDTNTNYLHRMTPLHLIATSHKKLTLAQLRESYMPLLVKALKDPVVNVRFAAARTLVDVLHYRREQALKEGDGELPASFREMADEVGLALEEMRAATEDGDEIFFATEALKQCS